MSNIRSPWLWATASSVALTGAAQAQSGPPDSGATAPWAGFYAGINLGHARHHATTTDVNNYSGIPPFNYVSTWFDSGKSSFTFGGQAGYNWQYNHMVAGVEADFNWVGAKTTFAPPNSVLAMWGGTTAIATATNELKWLATFRGRAGVAYRQFFLYGTAGLAVGRVANSWAFGDPPSAFFPVQGFSTDKTRIGVVYGGGLEYAASHHWTARVEGLFVDLGTTSQTITIANPMAGGTGPFRSEFKNTATIVRGALNYKW